MVKKRVPLYRDARAVAALNSIHNSLNTEISELFSYSRQQFASKRLLTNTLADLQLNGLIQRRSKPVGAWYFLTPKGNITLCFARLVPILPSSREPELDVLYDEAMRFKGAGK